MDGVIFVIMVSFWKVCQIRIMHNRNLQDVDYCLIDFTIDFILKYIGKPCSIKKCLKEIVFWYKSLSKKLYELSF